MKKYREIILPLLLFAAAGCEKSEYRITEPRPTLEVTALQDSYIINQPAYLQLKVSQQGYDEEFQISAVLSEGACELSMQGSNLPTDGTWTSMSNTTEILTLTPTLAGPLRISSSKYQIVEPKPQLSLSTVATVCELGQAVSLTLAVSQEGVDGNFSLSAFIREGKATLTLDGSDMDTSGQWV